jgi:hypothetical protein
MKPFAYFRGVGFSLDVPEEATIRLCVDDTSTDQFVRALLHPQEAAALCGALLAAVGRAGFWEADPALLDMTLRELLEFGLPDTVEAAIRQFDETMGEALLDLKAAEERIHTQGKEGTP